MRSLPEKKSLMDQTYDVIVEALCDGTFKPGDRLTQEDIALRLNVSRQPVTHALAVLKAQGFVEPVGKRGLTVTPVDPAMFEAIYQFRSAVEPLAVVLATPRLTADDILKGRSLVEHGRNMVVANDPRASLNADIAFHSFIHDKSGNPLIAQTMRLNWQHLQRAMSEVLRYPGMSIAVWQEHNQILETMIRGDAADAGELMRRHLLDAYARVTGKTDDAARPTGGRR